MLDMIKCSTGGAYYARGEWVPADGNAPAALAAKGFDAAAVENAKTGTMAYSILQAHNTSGDAENLKIKFDAMASHDITFVGIIQTARASGLEKFPIPYVLTNCHNSLCAVGGTINEDDHRFGLSAAKKYGGIFVPPHLAVIHQYMREKFAGCGKMILGSDSHTRYGANMYTTDEVDNLWVQLDREMDPAVRQDIMNQGLQALKDCWSCVPVLDTNYVCAAQKNIGGFEASDRLTDLTQIYFIG